MAGDMRQQPRTESLTVRVMRAEQRLLDRRLRVKAGAATLGRSIRARMSSPVMLVVAGGFGLLAGLLTGRRRRPSAPKDAQGSTGGLLRGLLRLISLIRSLIGA